MENDVKKVAIQFEELSNDAQGQLTGGFGFVQQGSVSVAIEGTNNCSCPKPVNTNVNGWIGCSCTCKK